MPALSLLELKVRRELMEKSLDFYTALGFIFRTERQEDGPFFYVSENQGFTFKLCPLSKAEGYPMPHARLGFCVTSRAIDQLEEAKIENWKREYGYVTRDPMGRFVELTIKA